MTQYDSYDDSLIYVALWAAKNLASTYKKDIMYIVFLYNYFKI
jgi:hypothetical protein